MTKCPKCGHELAPPNQTEFDKWYQAYPRRIGKGGARRAYATALTKIDVETLLLACEAYARAVSGKERDFIPHPATWLNQERWLDDGITPEPAKAFHFSWDGDTVVRLMAAIGKDHAVAYFSDTELAIETRYTAEYGFAIITTPSEFRVEKILRTYGPQLAGVFPKGFRVRLRFPAPAS